MNFKNLFLLSLVSLTFASCGDDDDDIAPTKTDLLTTPTWVFRAEIESGVLDPISPDDCEYDDTVKFSAEILTLDYNDDTSCGGELDEIPDLFPYTFDEATDMMIINDDGFRDTFTVSRLTATELWLTDADNDGVSLEAL